MKEGRDHWWHASVADQPDTAPTEAVEAEAPLLLVYTSGTTGRPKGCVLTHCGFATKVNMDLGLVMDFKPGPSWPWAAP